ncbi:junctional adhesion molecule B isoform X2 [Tachyglossus aculeatus]|uniref:junctional adhesion molecule B isoform X2 n=1 Tax=Tachyglossus aculeatus TaxID=9261 RepID=UPI0018F4D487|nr:junctional adhesion molecule B isoform X2 [Tachyglossus aculeatus]
MEKGGRGRGPPAGPPARAHPRLLLLLRCLVVVLGCPKACGLSEEEEPRYVVTATEFQEAILVCKAPKKAAASRLEWKKLGRGLSFVYYQEALQGDFRSRAEMIGLDIRIKNVSRGDAGHYRCEVSAPSDRGQHLQEQSLLLKVLVAPAVPGCQVPSSALSGTVVELRCREEEGIPASEYSWFRDGVRLPDGPAGRLAVTNSSYTLDRKSGTLFNTVSALDSGVYVCEAHNAVGSRRCPGKTMQVDDLNVGGIVTAAVVVILVMAFCGLGVCYAQKKGYFSRGTTRTPKPLPGTKAISDTPNPSSFRSPHPRQMPPKRRTPSPLLCQVRRATSGAGHPRPGVPPSPHHSR